ncbi:MAG: S1 RNA-binding domain-containing protein [Prevotella sp.]
MIELGKNNRLRVVKEVDFGMYLDGGDHGEILLPARYVPKGCKPGDETDVFLYLDQDERLIATTLQPLAMVGQFACLEVAWVNEFGAFLNWGLMKDLFCPFREQKQRMIQGRHYVVYVKVDEDSYRIMATAKVEKYLSTERPPYKHGDEVQLLVWQKTDLGFKVIVDNKFQGLVYDNQIFRALHTGDTLTGYVDHIRQDGKMDITIQRTGRQLALDFSTILLQYLKDHDGKCHLCDKSDAAEIAMLFKVSKKTFKKAVGDLYRQRLIAISDEGITLL